MDVSDSRLAEILADLVELGLTYQESVVYSELVAMGPSHARRISERAHLPREDSYRVLKRLEAKGLVEVHLDKPAVFAAIEPRAAVRSFISKVDARSHDLKQKAYDLGVRLERIKGTAARYEEESARVHTSVVIIAGRRVFAELERLIGECQTQYAGAIPAVSFLTVQGNAFLENLVAAQKRGVDVRVITCFTPKIIESVRKYSRNIEIRHNDEMSRGIRFSILDEAKVTLALAEPTRSQEDARMMCSTIPTLARELAFHFEQMWSESKSAAQWRVREPNIVGIH